MAGSRMAVTGGVSCACGVRPGKREHVDACRQQPDGARGFGKPRPWGIQMDRSLDTPLYSSRIKWRAQKMKTNFLSRG
jgi:hypothetical protein